MAIANAHTEPRLEEQIQEFGLDLWRRIQGQAPGIFHQQYWQARLLDRAMRDEQFKVNLLRLVDVLPALSNATQVTEHAQEYLLNDGAQLPALLRGPLRVAGSPGLRGLASTTIKGQVRRLGQRFIMGATPQEALPTLRRLHSHGIGFTADLLGEATLSVEEAHAYVRRYLDLIDTFAERTAQWPEQPLVDFNHLGRVPRANVSIKVSALDPSLDVLDPRGAAPGSWNGYCLSSSGPRSASSSSTSTWSSGASTRS
jgi:RHH-type proline utilization regulon transcriptional repressor/proline dehydrogenase/delta 1-pyrroline-5-carboxylate dehydrogenase